MPQQDHTSILRRRMGLLQPTAARRPSSSLARRSRSGFGLDTAVFVLSLSALVAPACGAQQSGFPHLTGPYLGQTPPVEKRAKFAPGIVSTEYGNHSSPAFTPDGNELYWSMGKDIWFSRRSDAGAWTEPQALTLGEEGPYEYDNPFVTPDGEKLFFTRWDSEHGKETIWYAHRSASGLSDPKPLSEKVNGMRLHWSLSVSNSGTLYFQGSSQDRDGYGKSDIYASKLVGGEYQEPVNLGPVVNTGAVETCPYIAPDESYLLYNHIDETDREHSGILISYRDESGQWLPPVIVIGGASGEGGLSPRISPDGKYLFYINGDEGTWWVPTASYPELRGTKRQGER